MREYKELFSCLPNWFSIKIQPPLAGKPLRSYVVFPILLSEIVMSASWKINHSVVVNDRTDFVCHDLNETWHRKT